MTRVGPPSFKSTLAILLCWAAMVFSAAAQSGLRDIPDTGVEAQLEAFNLRPGAEINLFAGEPAVANPTHMNWDEKGRLWVVSSPLYPHIQPGQEENDKIVVLEDTTGDGVADQQTEFATDLHIPTAVLPGDGGVYVANSVEVLFLRDTDGDDVADERHVVLSGFGTEDTHHLVHTFRWGPEGMVWMNQSIYIHTHLETPYGIRRLLGGGMWHYRPETQRAEVFMKGLINPWGHAFDDWGQSFLTDGAGSEGINFVFPRAVFKTSPGASRVLGGLSPGQPKHCGLEILTGRHLPEDLRGVFAAPDFRGHRINLFQLSDEGSAYSSKQIEDLVSSSHGAFRPIDIKMGPDGAIYVADWYNPIIQHGEVDFRDPRRDHKHGRIWRIAFEDRDPVEFPDLAEAENNELIEHLNAPEGFTRQAAMIETRNRDTDAMLAALSEATTPQSVDPDLFALRKIWASQALNAFDASAAANLLASDNHKARAASLRAIYYTAASNDKALELAERAMSDPHPQVRLWGVSVLAQLPDADTVKIALRALERIEVDEFLDFALWSICREHADRWVGQAADANPFENMNQLLFAVRALNEPVAVPQILTALESNAFATDEKVAEVADLIGKVGSAEDLNALLRFALEEDASTEQKRIVLEALANAGKLRKLHPAGDNRRISRFLEGDNVAIFSSAATLAGLWKLESARDPLETAFRDAPENESRARAALDGLVSLGGPKSAALFDETANDDEAPFLLRSLAVIGRTRMNLAEGAKLALEVLNDSPDGKDPHGIFDAFLANKQGPGALSAALKGSELPQAIALTGVQKAGSAATKPEGLVAALRKAADLKPMKPALTDAEMETMMEQVAEEGDPHRGEAVYRRAALQCMVCHAIGGAGGVIGPDLVSIGASAPVDYLIESLLQPSEKIKEGYHTTLVTLKNGDAFAGAVAREDAHELVVRDATGRENRIPKSDIASHSISPVSLMPPGLTAQLREDEFVDLVKFMAELGKDGEFKIPTNRFVRHWQVLQPHERTRDAVGFYGNKIFAEDFETYQWTPMYAKVDGDVPVDEMPEVVGRGKNRYGVARTFFEAADAGPVRFKISGNLKNIAIYHGETEIDLPDSGNTAEIVLDIEEPGRQKLTVIALHGDSPEDFAAEAIGEGTVTLLETPEF
ncbi:MAG: PVC-type heme-binding CxxCH protein [Verrucomicrobiales bacterium]